MKKLVIVFIFIIFLSMPIFAQGYYFDIGINNIGANITVIESNGHFSLLGYGLGLIAGFGPLDNMPIYIVGEISASVRPVVNLFFGGAGIIYYPVTLIQLGLTLGFSIPIINHGDDPNVYSNGFGWNISAAFDLGKNNHGCLIGLKYSGALLNDPIKTTDTTMLTTDLGIFLKYAYRKKVSKQTTDNAVKQSISNLKINKAITRASQNLINNLPEKSRLAVINIASNNDETSAYAVEELEYQLVTSKKFIIVDRNTLNTIRTEQNFQMSGEVSDESAVSIGQMMGANIVITGSISGTGKTQRLSLRALDVRTAEIVTMVREEF